ncbi:unnamed protein product [Closterium sp. NIES-53]
MYLMTCTRPDLAFPLSVLSHFVATGRHRPAHWTAAMRVAKYLATTSGMGLVLGGTQPVVLTGHCDSSYADDVENQRLTQGYYFSLGASAVPWRSTRSSSVASSSAEAEIYAGAMAAQELCWLTFLLADLGERLRSAPTLYADNKTMILLCQEPRLESRVKHIDQAHALQQPRARTPLHACEQQPPAHAAATARTASAGAAHSSAATRTHALQQLQPRASLIMAAPRVLRFDAEARALEFPSWLIRAEQFLKSQRQDNITLWAHASGDLLGPPSPPDLGAEPNEAAQAHFDKARTARSVWQSRDTAACIALSNLLPETKEAHFSQVRFAKDLLAAIKTRYSTPTSASLGRLFLPFLFPDLSLFDRVADLITHLRSLDVSYRATCTEAQLALLPLPMAITIHFIATSLRDRLAHVHDELLRKHPSELTIDVLETALKDIESNIFSVASASGTVVPPLFQGCTVPQLPTFTVSLASTVSPSPLETAAVSTVGGRSKGKGGKRGGKGGGAGGGGGGGGGSGDTSASGGGDTGSGFAPAGLTGGGTGAVMWYTAQQRQQSQQQQPQSGQPQQQVQRQVQQQPQQWGPGGPGSAGRGGGPHSSALRGVTPPSCPYVVQSGGRAGFRCGRFHAPELVDVLDSVSVMYADVDYSAAGSVCLRVRILGYLSVASVDLCLSSLGACVSALGACVATSPGAPTAEASLSFMLDSGASQCFFRDHMTLTPLLAPVPVALVDPTSRPAVARSSTILPCLLVLYGVLRGLHIPSFTLNMVGVGYLQDRWITVTFLGGGRTAVCTDAATSVALATFTRESRSGLYVLHTEGSQVAASPQVATSPQVAVSGHVAMSGLVAASCSCRSLSHPTVLWHHRLGHPSLPRLRSMASQRLVSGLPRIFMSLPPSPAPLCTPCVEGRLRATPHSSSLRPATAPFQTLHLDVWGLAPCPGPERESFLLVVIDDYSRYTTVFPLAKKSEVTSTLIRWLLATESTRCRCVSCLHSDRGGEFCSGILRGFCSEQGITKSWTLPESPQHDGVAERRIGLVMEIAPEPLASCLSASLWTGSPGVASEFRVWGCLPLVRDTSADKLSARAITCVFLGFLVDSSDYTFYHPPLHRFLDSRDVRFSKSVSYYTRYPCRGLPVPPLPFFSPPLLLLLPLLRYPHPPLVLPHHSPQQPSALPRPVTMDYGGVGAGGASSGGAGVGGTNAGGASSEGARAEGVGAGGTSSKGVGAEATGPGGARSKGTRAGGAGTGGASSGGARPGDTSFGGAGAGGSSSEETGAGGTATVAPTPPPHRYPTSFQRLRQLEREQCERLEQERLGLEQQRCSSRAHPSSPFDDPRTVLLRSIPRRSPPQSVLPSPPGSSLTASTSTPITEYYHATRPVVTRVLASLVTDPRASPSSVSALSATVTDFAATRRLDYATRVVAARPLSAGVESALGCDVLEDRQFELEFLAAASPHLCAMLLAPEGDPDALDIPTPRKYREAVSGQWASQWIAAMESEMASWRSTCTYLDAVPPPRAN